VLDTLAGDLVCQPGAAELMLQRLQPKEVLEGLRAAAQVGSPDGCVSKRGCFCGFAQMPAG
jgi:hypothetical protein